MQLRIAAALATVYVVWGSTYLAIAVGIRSLPPFTMLALRFLLAGALLYAWARFRGAGPPTLRH
jgi:drug/metabolite transporter (DMT)-like permease